MYFKHVFEKGLAQNSYLVGCQATGEAIVIDPKRDIDDYLQVAAENDLRITHITETHIHADFLSGTRELAAATGATVYLSDEGGASWQYGFDHRGLRHGESISVGNLRLDVLHTPGHTPEHLSFVLHDLPAGEEPMMVFTGDFVFVGDVGRPDLLEEAAGIRDTKVAGAKQMYRSLDRFRQLPDYVQVWPGHGAGSACGKSLGAVPASSVGYEKATNWALRPQSEEQFVAELLDGQPEPPYYFAEMKRRNRDGAPVLGERGSLPLLSAERFHELLEAGAQLVDTRDADEYAAAHIPGSIAIPMDSGLSTWAGWTLAYDQPIVLIASAVHAEEIATMLIRVGLDRVEGYVENTDAWLASGGELATTRQLSADELRAAGDDVQVLDVRAESEFQEGHVPGAVNIRAGRLAKLADLIPVEQDLVVHCQSGFRSIIACSALERLGVRSYANLSGGFEAWEALEDGPVQAETRDEREEVVQQTGD